MPRNSSGTYSLPAGNPVVTNTLIQSTWANNTLSDVSTAMTDSLDRNGRGAMLAPLKNIDGTAVAPAVTFSSEGTMGIYRAAAGVLGFAIGGALVLSLTSTGLTFATPVVLPLGTAAAPALTFVSNTNTGIYSPGTNQVSISTNGVDRLAVNATGSVSLSTGALVLAAAGANSIAASNAVGTLLFQTGGLNTRLTIDAAGLFTFATAATFSGAVTFSSTQSYAGTVTFNNNVPLDWKDAGGTGRRILNVSAANDVSVGDLDNALTGRSLTLAGNAGVNVAINGTAVVAVSASQINIAKPVLIAPGTSEVVRVENDGAFISFYNSANSTRSGYLQMNAAGDVTLSNDLVHSIVLATQAITRVTIDSIGNVGQGVTPSAWGSSYKAYQTAAGAYWNFSTAAIGYTVNAYDSGAGAWTYLNTAAGAFEHAVNVSGGFVWSTAPGGTAGGAVSFTQAMQLNGSGNLSVVGTVTAPTFIGNLTGNASGSSGSTTGNAATATALQTARLIGGVSFNGTANITPTTVAAGATDGTNELGWKDIVPNAQTSAYTLVLADRGKSITITTGGVTVPNAIFSNGNVVTITNNSATAQTITQGASMTMHQAGTANTGNRSLLPWGIATVEFLASNLSIITGNIT